MISSEYFSPYDNSVIEANTLSFPTETEAKAHVRSRVDVPVKDFNHTLDNRLALQASSQVLDCGRFTNIYDLSYDPDQVVPGIAITSTAKSMAELIAEAPKAIAAFSAGFFFLADRSSSLPREIALNLAIADGNIHSLLVLDREAVISDGQTLRVQNIRALGELTIGNETLTWAGSLSNHDAEVQIFGNGNTAIRHEQSEETGNIRMLDEVSRFTPSLDINDGKVDLGLISKGRGNYVIESLSQTGYMDLFQNDAVLRASGKYALQGLGTSVQMRTIDSLSIGAELLGAVTSGPMMSEVNFLDHRINHDPSLGDRPPFIRQPLARSVLYEAADGMVHVRLYDGRPDSAEFNGVTPQEAVSIIAKEQDVVWGCFLDPGQTARLCTRNAGRLVNYGNTYYLRWPESPEDGYTWVPAVGRPTASAIMLK